MKRYIVSSNRIRSIKAADEGDTRVDDMMNSLKDDFDYAMDGFDKLVRSGKVAEALSIMNTLSESLNQIIQDSSEQIIE